MSNTFRISRWPPKKREGEPEPVQMDPVKPNLKRSYHQIQDDGTDQQLTLSPSKRQNEGKGVTGSDTPATPKPERFAVYGVVNNTGDPLLEFRVQTTAYGTKACAFLRNLEMAAGGRHQLATSCMENAMAYGQQTMIHTLVNSYTWPIDTGESILFLHTRITTRVKSPNTCTLCGRCPCQIEYDEDEALGPEEEDETQQTVGAGEQQNGGGLNWQS
ncbi:hypothetical protein TWF481_010398 [Arthrobotrys musiformis]|uniref:Uncharacterized protein n=1 Tax=Arthrobotrys musiformis TaxID=47236 RepID=A0AAV9W2I9_9PEZI